MTEVLAMPRRQRHTVTPLALHKPKEAIVEWTRPEPQNEISILQHIGEDYGVSVKVVEVDMFTGPTGKKHKLPDGWQLVTIKLNAQFYTSSQDIDKHMREYYLKVKQELFERQSD